MFTERLRSLTPYTPGEQPREKTYIKLNTNENPYPPAPAVADILGKTVIEDLRKYPDPTMWELRKAIARRHGVQPERVFTGNGSDEVLSFIFYGFFEAARGPLLFPDITYSFYPVFCDFYGIPYYQIPVNREFHIDLTDYINRPSCGTIIANPNAPTGITLPLSVLKEFLESYPRGSAVVIDEAYIDFGGETVLPLLEEHENLILVRTFSKSMSLAGIRLGYVLASEKFISALFTVKDSFNSYPVNTLTQQVGTAAVNSRQYYETSIETIKQTRDYLSSKLREMGWTVFPSEANFVLTGSPRLSGEEVYSDLKKRGILVRYFDKERIRPYVRITVGTRDQIDVLLKEIRRR
jgi:histidinol-phosphate aminotransferase